MTFASVRATASAMAESSGKGVSGAFIGNSQFTLPGMPTLALTPGDE
jgi:hypothetical protein